MTTSNEELLTRAIEDFISETITEISEQSDSAVVEDALIEENPIESDYPESENIQIIPENYNEKLPENSSDYTLTQMSSRFSSAIWYDEVKSKTITLAGLGGIGSYVAYLLSRLNPAYMYIYDDDTVEPANMSGQMFSIDDLGSSKVAAVTRLLHKYSNYFNLYGLPERFNSDSGGTEIMICGFDNMEARKTFFNVWKSCVMNAAEIDRKHYLFIDGRLAAEEFQVLCIRGDDSFNIERYEKEWLFSDDEADATVCSYKQTTFMANMIGSIIVNLFVNFCANDIEGEEHPFIERDLPFLTTYDASMMMFKTEA